MRKQDGQTVIEMALLMILILFLFFGIAEFARAWWLKGQLNNAARVGARVAVVTTPLTASGACTWSGGSCRSSGDSVAQAACNSITSQDLCGSPAAISVSLTPGPITPPGTLASPNNGDEITVQVTGSFTSVVSNLLSGTIGSGLRASATMRHE